MSVKPIIEERLRCPECGSPVAFRVTGLLRSDSLDPRPLVQVECSCTSPRGSGCPYDVIYEETLEVPRRVVKEDY